MNEAVGKISFDTLLDAMAHVQRRKLLMALMEHNPQDDLPVVIGDDGDAADVMDRLVTMHHQHLPKLAEYGFIEWDRDSHEVHKGPQFQEIRPLLKLLDAHGDELPPDWL